MTVTIPLEPEVEAKLTAESERIGLSVERLASAILEVYSTTDRLPALIAALDSIANDRSEEDQRADGEAVIAGLNETRRANGQRILFPPEKKGITW